MSSTSQPQTYVDLYTEIMNRVRVDTTQTATKTQAQRYANIGLTDMHVGTRYKFPWAERTGMLQTRPQYTTGTVSINQGSTALVGVGTAWNTADVYGINNTRANGKVVIAGGLEPYNVLSVGSDTTITLSQAFIRANVSAVSYIYYEDEYALASDFLRPVEWASFDLDRLIRFPPRSEFYRRYTRNSQPGRPKDALLIDKAFNGSTVRVRRLVLGPPPIDTYLLPYRYLTANLAVTASGVEGTAMVNDTDEPIVPLEYRLAIVYHALYNWYRDKKDDTRSQEAQAAYNELMMRTLSDVEIGARWATLQPNVEQYANSAYHPYNVGGENGYYTVGTSFDQMGTW